MSDTNGSATETNTAKPTLPKPEESRRQSHQQDGDLLRMASSRIIDQIPERVSHNPSSRDVDAEEERNTEPKQGLEPLTAVDSGMRTRNVSAHMDSGPRKSLDSPNEIKNSPTYRLHRDSLNTLQIAPKSQLFKKSSHRSKVDLSSWRNNEGFILEQKYRERFEKAELEYANSVLEAKKASLGRRLDIEGLRKHQLKVNLDMQQRELDQLRGKSTELGHGIHAKTVIPREPSAFRAKQMLISANLVKKNVYSRVVMDKVELRSDPAVIQEWRSIQQRDLFGSVYLEKVRFKKQEKLKKYDPDKYLYESIEIGKSSASLPRLDKPSAKRRSIFEEEPQVKKFATHKEMLQELVDAKKVRDKSISNRDLNYYERVTRAMSYQQESKIEPKHPELANDIAGLSTRFSKHPSEKLLQRFMNMDESVHQQIQIQQFKEKFLPKHRRGMLSEVGIHNPTQQDSIELLSKSIHCKLKVLDSLSLDKLKR